MKHEPNIQKITYLLNIASWHGTITNPLQMQKLKHEPFTEDLVYEELAKKANTILPAFLTSKYFDIDVFCADMVAQNILQHISDDLKDLRPTFDLNKWFERERHQEHDRHEEEIEANERRDEERMNDYFENQMNEQW